MGICPYTLKPCIDDICYVAGCLRAIDMPILVHCGGCGELIGIDGSDPLDACKCPGDDDSALCPICGEHYMDGCSCEIDITGRSPGCSSD